MFSLLLDQSNREKEVFFAFADIKDAYDSVSLDRLFKILGSISAQLRDGTTWTILEYKLLDTKKSGGKLSRQLHYVVCDGDGDDCQGDHGQRQQQQQQQLPQQLPQLPARLVEQNQRRKLVLKPGSLVKKRVCVQDVLKSCLLYTSPSPRD